VYGATKAALEGFARSLREELRGRVGVQIVHPGATRTGMHAKSGMPPDRVNERRFPSPMWTAERIVRAIERNAAVTTRDRSIACCVVSAGTQGELRTQLPLARWSRHNIRLSIRPIRQGCFPLTVGGTVL